jgi:hypothetical protein
MRTFYNILFTIFFVLSSPYYFWRMRRRGNWRGASASGSRATTPNLKQALTNRHVIWLHAVSVGEVNLCTQLIRALEPRLPNIKFVVSTTTTTGMAELRRRLPTHISKIYYPVDRRKFVGARWRSSTPRPSCWSRRKSGRISSGVRNGSKSRFFWRTRGCPTVRFAATNGLDFCSGRSSRRSPASACSK